MRDQVAPAGEGFWADADDEQALERFRTLVDMVDDGVYQLDARGRFVAVNDAIVELTGYARAELVGEHASIVLADEDVDRIQREISARLADDASGDEPIEFTAKTADGTEIPCELELHPLVEDGSFRGTIGIARDIADRKRTERALEERERELRRKERRYEAIFEDPNILVGLLDSDGRVRDINGTAMEYVDAELEALLGEPFWETPWWGAGDDDESAVREWTERAADGEYVDFEADLTRPDGEPYTISGYFRPVTDEDGEVTSIIVSDRDVTERKARERELELFRTLLDHSTDSVLVIDPESGRFVDVNETACERHGYSRETFLDLAVPDVETEIPDREAWTSFVRELRDERQLTFDGTHRRADGTTYPVEVSVSYVDLDQEYVLAISRDVTERREYERKLEESERRLSTLMTNVPGMVYRCRDERGWPMEFVSDACAELTGYAPERLESGEISWGEDIMVQADREDLWETVHDAAADGEPFSETYRIETADGERRWVRDYGRSVVDDAGDVVAIEGIIADITERKRLETELTESERRYRTLVENFPNGAIGLFDENLEYQVAGGGALADLDTDPDEIVGQTVWERYPDDLAETMAERFRDALAGESSHFELEFHDRYWAAHTVPIRNDEGEIFAGMVMVLDITDRKEMERELRESEAKFRMVTENADEIIWMTTPDTEEFLYVNPAYEEIYGQDREALYEDPRAFADRLHPDDRERVMAAWERLPEESFEAEFRIVRPDGETRWVHAQATRIHDESGDVTRIVGTATDVTERREHERRLEKSERRYRTLAEHFPNGVVGVYDHDLRYTLVAGELAGDPAPSPEEAEGTRMPDLYPDDVVADLEPLFRAAIEDGETGSVQTTVVGRHWQVWATPLRDADGEIFAGLSFAQDITEQVERERALEEAKSQFEAATEAGAVGTWEWHIPEDEMVVGSSFARTFGLDPERAREGVPLDRFVEAIHPEDRDRVATAIEEAVETGGDYEEEYRVWNADGELRWVVARGHVECDEDGEPVRFPGALTDITERKRAELELQRNNEQLETLFAVLPVGVVVAEADGEIVEANDTARDIWGGDVFDAESVEEYERYPVRWADSGESVAPEEMTLARVVDGEEVAEPDVFEIDPVDGDRRIIEAKGLPIRDEAGEVVRGVVTISDVTERREYQRRLETSNERLEQFAYAASHDLQEPLRMVTSYLQLIESRYADQLDGDAAEFIEFAVDGADRMREMIDGLLAYSRVESGGEPLEPTDLNAVLDDVLEDLRLQIEESDAEITSESLPTVRGDASQLRQLFQNLLDNAIEYSGDAPPRIDIAAERAGDRWRITVSDRGIGIDPDYQDDIFEVFNRLHSRDEHAGTGIGLALCSRIVERHGGEITVDSDPGEGATFAFTLPAATDRDRT